MRDYKSLPGDLLDIVSPERALQLNDAGQAAQQKTLFYYSQLIVIGQSVTDNWDAHAVNQFGVGNPAGRNRLLFYSRSVARQR